MWASLPSRPPDTCYGSTHPFIVQCFVHRLTIHPSIHSAFSYSSLPSSNPMADHLHTKPGFMSVVCPKGWSNGQRALLGQGPPCSWRPYTHLFLLIPIFQAFLPSPSLLTSETSEGSTLPFLFLNFIPRDIYPVTLVFCSLSLLSQDSDTLAGEGTPCLSEASRGPHSYYIDFPKLVRASL